MKTAIVTDSNSGITISEASKLGIYLLPMPFYVDNELFYEELTISQTDFFEKLRKDVEISTSQPSPGEVMEIWNKALAENDELVYIPMSSGLSKSCETAQMLASSYEEFQGKVFVVDNQRISVTTHQSVLDALSLSKKGKSAKEIKDILEEVKFESSIYLTLETLKYLKKGGRITPAAAAIGTVLNLKPILQIQGEKLDAFDKTRGKKKALQIMLRAVDTDLKTRFAYCPVEKMHLLVAYSGEKTEEVEEWVQQVTEFFGREPELVDPLSLSVSCHVGDGVLALAVAAPLPEKYLN